LVAEIHENVQAGKTKRLAAKDEATGYTHDMVAEVLENVLVEQGKRRAESRVKSVAV